MSRLRKTYSLKQNITYHTLNIYYGVKLWLRKTITKDELDICRYEAWDIHSHKRQRYADDKPYYYHVNQVALRVERECGVLGLSNEDTIIAIKTALGHDFIEDVCLTFNDVSKAWGNETAMGIYVCTEEKGRNRTERHSKTFYRELNISFHGLLVKLCDILCNMEQGQKEGSSMFTKYQQENVNLHDKLEIDEDHPLYYLVIEIQNLK